MANKIQKINSKRTYIISFIEGTAQVNETLVIDEIITTNINDNDFEYIYALQEQTDDVLDLKVGERLLVSFNRDNPEDSQGFIKRIN